MRKLIKVYFKDGTTEEIPEFLFESVRRSKSVWKWERLNKICDEKYKFVKSNDLCK